MALDMMYLKRLLESINLRVGLPMILEVDNKGEVDSINNYSVGGSTCHMETRQYYLMELKEEGVMLVNWKACIENSSDLYTKSSARKEFEIMQGHMLVMTLTWYINSFPWYCHKGRVSEVTLLL